jgi:hypothetical protein
VKRRRGRPKRKGKIRPQDRRDFAWLSRKLTALIKKWGLQMPVPAREQTQDMMFSKPKRRYD